MLRWTLFVLLIAGPFSVMAQDILTPINHSQRQLVDQYMIDQKIRQSAFAPQLLPLLVLDSLYDASTERWTRKQYSAWIIRKLKNEHLFEVRTPTFYLNGDALLNLEFSPDRDSTGRNYYTNSRGYQFNGVIGSRVFFSTSFLETQSIFPQYMDSVVFERGNFNQRVDPERGSVPGFGRWKPYNTSDSYDYDYTMVTGSFGVRFKKRGFLQFGHDRQFLGHGYRSMLLSDVSAPYTFVRMHLTFLNERVSYTTTWAVLQSLDKFGRLEDASGERLFQRLGARFSYLSVHPNHRVEFGLFDGTTWTWRDNNHPISVEYFSPHAWLYTGSGIRNHMVGLNAKFTPHKWLTCYGQMARNTGTRSNGYQLGIKSFGILPMLSIRAEYNVTGPSLYYHHPDSANTMIAELFQEGTAAIDYYQHNDQVLAHPFGTASRELLLRVAYRWRDFNVGGRWTRINRQGDGQVFYQNYEVSYIVNPMSMGEIVLGYTMRSDTKMPEQLNYPYIAIRTNLFNRYQDF